MILLSKEQIIAIHDQVINRIGGSYGIRDERMLESALATINQSFGGVDLYPSLEQKAARLCFGLVENHPFIDGNKRVGVHAMLAFLILNGVLIEYTQQDLIDITFALATGNATCNDLHEWILNHQP